MNPTELTVNVETGETTTRELTADEIAALPEPSLPLGE
jgi:hypothetical protein